METLVNASNEKSSSMGDTIWQRKLPTIVYNDTLLFMTSQIKITVNKPDVQHPYCSSMIGWADREWNAQDGHLGGQLSPQRPLQISKSSRLSVVGNCPLGHARAPFWSVDRGGSLFLIEWNYGTC
ncbi:hypothetical protein OUZ56_017725 [Daphnia magna]|uniref:Uncharacterized protein n=1 Tax=Daphnia magna TaxID=35525 RepID=A0ABR0ATK2_9CRUS|nr:hypothetical protein OUZ56_017725 [Daphnia magna]